MAGKLIFVTGGIRSGKSLFAEKITSQLGQRVVYIATSLVEDDEMRVRVELHRERRSENWRTVEEALDVAAAITGHGADCDVIMIDCLTVLISNLMFHHQDKMEMNRKELQEEILHQISSLAMAAKEVNANVVVVSNEVGLSLVSDNYLGRLFQDVVGLANQIVAGQADEAYFVAAGYPIDLKSGRGWIYDGK